ncbi:MAG TPA: M48 family metallopeptidase [Bryobacteraceae bacterium]|nr:M48 family metallopeptidase [Bryobacteraceae bacterium]
MRPSIACLLLLAAATASAQKRDPAEIGKRDVGRGINFYSLEKEIALGREMAHDVELSSRILDDPVVSEYVNRLGQNLVRNSDALVPFTIKVIDSPEINAFALPGGFFFVHTGLILKADDEAELAGVMAHEIAHVAARHGTRQATRASIINYATIPLIFMGGTAGFAVRQAAGLAAPLGFLRFSRGMESEADMLGLQYMYKAGYDPTSFVDFFERIQTMEKRKSGTVSKLFSTHPMTKDRIKATQKRIQRDLEPLSEYVVDTSEFAAVKQRLVRIERRNQDAMRDLDRPVLLRRTRTTTAGEERPGR